MKFIFIFLILLFLSDLVQAETPWFDGSDYPPLPAGKSAAGLGDYPPPRAPATPPPLYPTVSPASDVPSSASANSSLPILPGLPGYNGGLTLPGLNSGLSTNDSIPMPVTPSPVMPSLLTPSFGNSLNNDFPNNGALNNGSLNNIGNASENNFLNPSPQNAPNNAANYSLIENPAAAAGSYRLPVLPTTTPPIAAEGVTTEESTLQGQLDGAWHSDAGDQLWIQGSFFQLSSPPRTLDSATASGWQPRRLTGEIRYLPQNRLIIRSQGIELQYKIYLDGQSFIAEDPNGARLRFERVWFTP